MSAANFSISDSDVSAMFSSLTSSIEKDSTLVDQVTTAQHAMFSPSSGADDLSKSVNAVKADLQASYGSMGAFISAQGVSTTTITQAEVKNALLAAKFTKLGDSGAFAATDDATRLKVLASTLKIALFLKLINGKSSLGLVDQTGQQTQGQLYGDNWWLVYSPRDAKTAADVQNLKKVGSYDKCRTEQGDKQKIADLEHGKGGTYFCHPTEDLNQLTPDQRASVAAGRYNTVPKANAVTSDQ